MKSKRRKRPAAPKDMTSPYACLTREFLASLYQEARDNSPWPPPEETIDIVAELTDRATDKAILVVVDGEQHWIPRSQIRNVTKIGRRRRELEVTLWWVKQANLTEYL